MLRRFPVIALQIPVSITSRDGEVVAVIPDRADAEWVCRWCYGRPMPGYGFCSRTECIEAVIMLAKLDEFGGDTP